MTSHSSASAVGPIAVAVSRAAARFTSSRAISAPAALKAVAVAAPIAPAAPVIAAIWPASGGSLRAPSLACSSGQYSTSNISASEIDSNRPIASASATPSIHCFGDVGGNDGVLLGAAEAEQAEAGNQDDAGQGIELPLAAADALVVALEIVSIILDESFDRCSARARRNPRACLCRRAARPAASFWCGWCGPA